MRRPVWRRDWAGFSGGWYPTSNDRPRELSILGNYGFGYYLDICAPVIGDLRVGYQAKRGRENPYRSPRDSKRAIVFDRRPLP